MVPSVIDVLFVDLPPLDFHIFFFDLTCSVFLLDVVSKYYCCREKGGGNQEGRRQLGHEVSRLDMAGIAKSFAILALRHLLIYHC